MKRLPVHQVCQIPAVSSFSLEECSVSNKDQYQHVSSQVDLTMLEASDSVNVNPHDKCKHGCLSWQVFVYVHYHLCKRVRRKSLLHVLQCKVKPIRTISFTS